MDCWKISLRLKKIETATATAAKKRNYGRSHTAENSATNTPFAPNVQAKPFVPSNQNVNRQGFFTNNQQVNRPNVPPPNTQQNGAVQPIDTANAPSQPEQDIATLASGEITVTRNDSAEATLPTLSPSKFLYVADKRNKCKYLIDTGAAVSVLPKSCANRTTDTLPLVAANNTTITTYGTSKRIVDIGLKREYAWTFIIADIVQLIIGADLHIHYSLILKAAAWET